jgi:hypothetical protein
MEGKPKSSSVNYRGRRNIEAKTVQSLITASNEVFGVNPVEVMQPSKQINTVSGINSF